jgi:biotin carboxylase
VTRDAAHVAIIAGSPGQLAKARAAGLHITWVTRRDKDDPIAQEHCDEVHLADFCDPHELLPLVERIHARRPLHRVVALTESALLPAAHVVSHLGLAGNGLEVVRLLSDKLAMRRHLAEHNLGPVAADLGRTAEDLRRFVTDVGPTIVKPRGGAGSLAVRAVDGIEDVAETWDWLTSIGLIPFLMEERLRGPEVSVETLSKDGRHVVVAVTGKKTGPGFVEVGHVVPAPLPADEHAATTALVLSALDALGLREGPAHTEVVITPDGPRVVEAHNRRGGDRIVDLVRSAHGIDIDLAAFRTYAGHELPAPRPARAAAAVRFLTPSPGLVVSVSGLDRAAAHPQALAVDVSLRPGDVVAPLRWSQDRAGLVIATGHNAPDACRHAEAMTELIEIDTCAAPDPESAPTRLEAIVDHVDVLLNGAGGVLTADNADADTTQPDVSESCPASSSTRPVRATGPRATARDLISRVRRG